MQSINLYKLLNLYGNPKICKKESQKLKITLTISIAFCDVYNF
jgi:hypothetical protein